MFSLVTTAGLIVGHWRYNRVMPFVFKPSKVEPGYFGVITFFYYAFITVPATPKSLWVLPPLYAITFWARYHHRPSDAGGWAGRFLIFVSRTHYDCTLCRIPSSGSFISISCSHAILFRSKCAQSHGQQLRLIERRVVIDTVPSDRTHPRHNRCFAYLLTCNCISHRRGRLLY